MSKIVKTNVPPTKDQLSQKQYDTSYSYKVLEDMKIYIQDLSNKIDMYVLD